jgi:hypothetical protein
MRRIRSEGSTLKASGLVLLAFFFAACNPIENKTQSASLLIVESISSSDAEGNAASFLQSDIIRTDQLTGASSWRSDTATATLSVAALDPAPIYGTSQYYDVTLTQYAVSNERTDGRNTPGTDVPYPFSSALSLLIRVGAAQSVSFIVVRDVAKQEPPLLNLRQAYLGDALIVTAKIDFYGHDMANHNVKATGYLPIFFANYADY